MSRIVRHQFRDTTEANAFVAGVEWVNDSAIQVIDIEVGDFAVVVAEDEDGDDDMLVDYLLGSAEPTIYTVEVSQSASDALAAVRGGRPMIDPHTLSYEALVEIAHVVQDALYLDSTSEGEFYNPDKEWDSEVLPFIVQTLDTFGLVPATMVATACATRTTTTEADDLTTCDECGEYITLNGYDGLHGGCVDPGEPNDES